ncbi:RNA methyltransferase [Piscinibacter sakaiensis]|uniref:RNA methyltransferase n=1 Tax=Piscinibacter sakaiensis TaxID=1547922 RepID=UPI003AABACDA
MQIDDIRRRLNACGAKPPHVQRILRLWAMALPQDSGRRKPVDFLPASVRAELPALCAELQRLATLDGQFADADGSSRLLARLADGQLVESVLLPRDGVCVSSQLGCAVGCVFCMTGRSGLLRQLGSAEIVAQVVLARTLRSVRKVVFMGMGEPAHNLDNVLDGIELLGTSGGIAHKNLVFSTVGDRRVFDRLLALPVGRVRPALALSLHTTDAALRHRLLPKAPPIAIDEMVELAERYARASGYPTQYQWTLLEGINDGDAEIDGIVRLLAGRYAILNLIPYNAVDDLPYRRPAWSSCEAIASRLQRRGILTTLRQSAAQSVDGGCGQLRARSLAGADAAPHTSHPIHVHRAKATTGTIHA